LGCNRRESYQCPQQGDKPCQEHGCTAVICKPSFGYHQMFLAQSNFPPVSENSGSSQVVSDTEVDNCSDQTSQGCRRDCGPKLKFALVHEEPGQWKDDFAGDGKGRAFKGHQEEDPWVVPLIEQIQYKVEYCIGEAQKPACCFSIQLLSNPFASARKLFDIDTSRRPSRAARLYANCF